MIDDDADHDDDDADDDVLVVYPYVWSARFVVCICCLRPCIHICTYAYTNLSHMIRPYAHAQTFYTLCACFETTVASRSMFLSVSTHRRL